MVSELVDKVENDDPEEKAIRKEATSKTQGTKDGKHLLKIRIHFKFDFIENFEFNELRALFGYYLKI